MRLLRLETSLRPSDLRYGARCPVCEALVFVVLLEQPVTGVPSRTVIDVERDRLGAADIAAYQDVTGCWHARRLHPGQALANHERRHLAHRCRR